jgi:hypothetical protein
LGLAESSVGFWLIAWAFVNAGSEESSSAKQGA